MVFQSAKWCCYVSFLRFGWFFQSAKWCCYVRFLNSGVFFNLQHAFATSFFCFLTYFPICKDLLVCTFFLACDVFLNLQSPCFRFWRVFQSANSLWCDFRFSLLTCFSICKILVVRFCFRFWRVFQSAKSFCYDLFFNFWRLCQFAKSFWYARFLNFWRLFQSAKAFCCVRFWRQNVNLGNPNLQLVTNSS